MTLVYPDDRVKSKLKEFVNTPTQGDEGFYALHYASFHGNVRLIKALVACGANPRARNKQHINMLHVAAQGDQAFSLTYFKDRGVPLDETDHEMSTPLHWASFSGSDTAIYYLLAWKVEVNIQDNMGFTPLHLAVRSAEHFPSTRAIKELLIRGADKQIRDAAGKKAADLAKEYQIGELREQLIKILVTVLCLNGLVGERQSIVLPLLPFKDAAEETK